MSSSDLGYKIRTIDLTSWFQFAISCQITKLVYSLYLTVRVYDMSAVRAETLRAVRFLTLPGALV